MISYHIDPDSRQPKYLQLYTLIKNDILNGSIKSGSKLPSKRLLSEHTGVSVITVDAAYAQLADEGYIYSKERSGYYVCDIEFTGDQAASVSGINYITDPPAENENISGMGFRYSSLVKIMREVITIYSERLLQKPPHYGCAELRNAIAGYLHEYRGMTVQPERIIIGSGAEHLYGMIVQLLGRDKIYGLENPSYKKIRQVYEANGAVCEMLDLDHDGISSDALKTTSADILHITPFHSFPTGISAPAAKRYEYLAWAAEKGGIIVEDDFDSEFSLNRKPVETVYSMDKNGCVIYINTFSHSLAPSMRMGYMVLPERFAELYEKKLGFYTCSVPLFDQYVLAEFISRGYFERHLNRVRRKLKRNGSL